ncbi:acyl-CoA dehydrogenase C-terminal domain-containing protein [Brevundimonas vesicularis]|uniref:acyl-CoA dehydrogenase C-terminal domain-containing protein n=1 Tax=Brevundimonas vesicularis TaxID=41276 RepID=UPI00384C6FDB
MQLFALTVCGYLMARQKEVAIARLTSAETASTHLKAKLTTTRFFIEQILPETEGLYGAARSSARDLLALSAA